MARKRLLSPEFFSSRKLSDQPIDVSFTFAGLWCYCDDLGRGEDDTAMVKASIYPRRRTYSTNKIETHLELLEKLGMICRYIHDSVPYLHVVNWPEHQKPSHPTPSRFPECPTHRESESGGTAA